jgi:L-malate glycosyltransferase
MNRRIVFFFSKIATGGAERQTVLLAKALMKRGYDCRLLSYYPDHSHVIVDDEIRPHVHFLNGGSMQNVWQWRQAWSHISAMRPDIVVSVNLSALPIAVLGRAIGRFDAGTAAVFHTTMFKDAKMRRTFPVVRLAMRFTDRLIYVCTAQREYWESRGLQARAADVIHNGVDTEYFDPDEIVNSNAEAKAGLDFLPDDYVIGMVAAFRPEKNHRQAIDALKALRERGLRAKLLLLGEGETRADIVGYAETTGLSSHVRFVPNQQDVRPFLKAMDVGLLCSTRGETFSMAALESMAMHVPMVMPRISGCVEMLAGGRGGRIFEIADTAGLTGCLLELSDTELRRRLAVEAGVVVRQHFTEAMMIEKYQAMFEALVAQRVGDDTPH